MNINCSTGKTLPVGSLEFFVPKIKSHSLLLLEDLKNSLDKEGLILPIVVQKQGEHIYIVDGEARVMCIKELMGDEFEVPVTYSRGDIMKNIIISSSSSHMINQANLNLFAQSTDINLKNYSFSNGDFMDFHSLLDIDIYFDNVPTKKFKETDYVGLLAEGVI